LPRATNASLLKRVNNTTAQNTGKAANLEMALPPCTSLILLGKDLPSDCSLVIIKLGGILSLTLAYINACEDKEATSNTIQTNVHEQMLHAVALNKRMKSIAADFQRNRPAA